jgi:hypothetical protein
MNIEIRIDQLDVNSIIAKTFERDEEGELIGETGVRLGDAVADKLVAEVRKGSGWHDDIKSRVKQIRDEEIRVACRDAIADALNQPLAATNSFGERTGAPTTLREMIFKEAQKALGTTGNRYDQDKSLIEKVIKTEIEAALKKELQPILDEAKAQVRVAANTHAAAIILAAERAMKA